MPPWVIAAIAPEQWATIRILAAFVEVACQLPGPARQLVVDAVRQQVDQLMLPDGVELRILGHPLATSPE